MAQSFLEKAAAKASLTNIKFDLDRLKKAFPHSPEAASKALIAMLENAGLALANHAPVEQVRSTILSADLSPELSAILNDLVELSAAAAQHDDAKVAEYGARIEEEFQTAVGAPLDPSQAPMFLKLAMRTASTGGTQSAKPGGCGCLVIVGLSGFTLITYELVRRLAAS